ncbi:polymerase 1 [Seminavis robusta]|uniref:Poly [ADP-ribose] polymerase n=1 Tax=Seminavis robusta TaxID=568900 RepID=A0A9N8EJT3_9STRA|nr:polymerase 1 [Seminavis robusta]|eukprot:Sro1047_g235110.1 polymerase 1 (3368) ;mRNA; r:3470-13814
MGKKRAAASPPPRNGGTPSKRRPPQASPLKEQLVKFEMKFAENEVVVALSDKENADDPKEKFWIGRLVEDVLLGDKNEENVKIRWFEYEEEEEDEEKKEEDEAKKEGEEKKDQPKPKKDEIVVLEEDQEDDDEEDEDDDVDGFPKDPDPTYDTTPIGSLVCSVTSLLIRQKGAVDEPTRWTVPPTAYDYANKKLQQQLEDSYDSENDSQFGDQAVEKRLAQAHKINHKYMQKHKKQQQIKKGGKKTKDEDDDDDDDGDGKKKKGKKKGGKKKSKKAGKRGLTPRDYIAPVPNPFTDRKTGKLETFSGDIERTGKEIIRAVLSKDHKALKMAVVDATDKVPTAVHVGLSVGCPFTGLMYAMVTGNIPAVKILLDDLKPPEDKNKPKPSRAYPQSCALPTLSTGKQTSRHANYNRRAINASRGGREGNNALLHDANGAVYKHLGAAISESQLPYYAFKPMPDSPHYCFMRDFDEIPSEVLDLAEATYSRSYMGPQLDAMMKAGHLHLVHRTLVKLTSHAFGSNSFNFLHVECLTTTTHDDAPEEEEEESNNRRGRKKATKKKKAPTKKAKKKEEEKKEEKKALFSKPVLARSVVKKSDTDLRFSPLACACINPNTAYLEKLLEVAPEHADVLDQKNTTLLHYAAACQGSGPVEFLLSNFPQQSPRMALDKSKEMPLHWAARAARPDNVRALLNGQSEDDIKTLLNAKTAEGMAPLHYAAQTRRKQNLETVRALLEAGADANLPSSAARNKVSPVHIAARMGDLPILKLLLEHKGNPSKGDKLGRSPLVHACMNGQTHIVAYLLGEVGVDPEVPDSSDNRPMHYAAAYGWSDCVKLLLTKNPDKEAEEPRVDKDGDTTMKDGDDPPATVPPAFTSIANPDPKNSWKTTALAVAIQKGRQEVASLLLGLPAVDINYPDGETGKTLFLRLVEVFMQKTFLAKQPSPFDHEGDDEQSQALSKEMPWALRKLFDRTDLDVSVTSPDTGYNVLHLLCSQEYPGTSGEERAVVLAKMVLSRISARADGKDRIDVDARDKEGMTPLLLASAKGNPRLLEFLISKRASVKADVVDKQGRNICHHLLGQRAHSKECEKQLALVEKNAGGEAEYLKLLELADNEGYTPAHMAMKTLCSGLADEAFDRGHALVKAICSRFPVLVRVRVGPTKQFTDPAVLANILTEAAEDSAGNAAYNNRRARNCGRITLSGADRVDANKIQEALKSIDSIVPVDCEDAGKTLLHLACESSNPDRINEMLEWLLSSAPGNVKLTAGPTNHARLTPVQYLVREKLTAGGFSRSKPLQNAKEEHKALISSLLDGVAALLAASGGSISVNDMPPLDEREASSFKYDAEKDTESVGDLRRLATAFQADSSSENGKKLVKAFQELMQSRAQRALTDQPSRSSLPVAVLLAKAGTSVVLLEAWDRLIGEFKLELNSPTERDTALLVSLHKKDMSLCGYLCERCPDLVLAPNHKTMECPVHVVAKMDDPEYVKLILGHIKSEKAINQARDRFGRTALHLSVAKAARRQGEALDPCELLFLKAGARVDTKDARQRTPLHYCFLDSSGGDDYFNFPHSLPRESHDRIDLVSSLLGAVAALQSKEGGSVKAIVDQPDRRGRTALFYAAAFNSTVSSLLLCNHGADLFLEDQDKNTPVNVAVLRGHANFCIALLKSRGAASNLPDLVDVVDVQREKTQNEKGRSVIKVKSRASNSIVWHAIKKGFRGLVYILLDSFPLSQAVVDAIDNGAFQLVRKLLTTSPPQVVQYVNPDNGRTLLHEVADVPQYQNPEWGLTMANLMLESGVLPAAVTKEGQTSLHISAFRGHVRLTELLATKDVSVVSVQDSEGHYPLGSFMRALPRLSLSGGDCSKMLDYLTRSKDMSLGDPEVNRVPRSKDDVTKIEYHGMSFHPGPNLETVKAEMSKRNRGGDDGSGAQPDVKHFSTLLVQAVRTQRLGLAQELINKGAKVDLPDSDGLAPIHHAVLSVSIPAAALLLRNGSNPNVTTEDDRALTPLMLATFAQSGEHANGRDYEDAFEVAKMLLRFGALVLPACQQTGSTALHFAVRENNGRMVELLLRASLYPPERESTEGSVEVKKGPCLVRFGGESALYPAEIDGDIVKAFGPSMKSELPRRLVSESFDHSDLTLDSLDGLVRLLREKKGIKQKSSSHVPGDKPRPPGGKFLRPPSSDDDDDDDDDDDLFGDSDSDDELLAAGNAGAGGVLVRCPKQHPASRHLTRHANFNCDLCGKKLEKGRPMYGCRRCDWDACLECAAEGSEKAELAEYYGLESLIVGATDKNLTATIPKGEKVIVQPKEGARRTYANAKEPWLEGTVVAVHENGSYDIDLIRGETFKDVLRQQIRHWKAQNNSSPSFDGAVKEVLSVRDKGGFTCIQAAVKAFEFGSFESIELVELLIKYGATVEADAIALTRPGSSFRAQLIAKMKDSSSVMDEDEPAQEMKKASALHGLEPIPKAVFEEQAKAALISLESKGMMKRRERSAKINKVCQVKAVGLHVLPVVVGAVGDSVDADVLTKKPKFYDVTMVAVEVTHHYHSENKYYKMQILQDPMKDLFVLLTNWGQVGDGGGQKQETPMGTGQEAVKEFEKIFKAKSGNLFEDCGTDRFHPVLGKYKPINLLASDYEKPEVPDISRMVADAKDFPEVVRKSSLPPALSETIVTFVDPSAIAGAAKSLGYNQDSLPLGRLSIESILEAETKLDDVEAALNEAKKFTKPEELGERRAALERVAILSSQLYELIPTREGDQALRPLDENSLKRARADLFSLKDLTTASQIVNTACVEATKVNPLDYAYRALNSNIDILDSGSTRTGIEQFFRNTCENDDHVINEVFAVDRMDEPSNAKLENHRLLWHGTSASNMMGILKEGLRVAPPSAQVTGAAFGEGVYLADMASKSFAYCRADFRADAKKKPRAYLLLADVALGKQERVTSSVYDTGEEYSKGDTVMAVGYEGPRTEQDVTFVSTGAVIPLGKSMRNPKFKPRAKWMISNRREASKEASSAIETARNSRSTKFPASVRMEYESKSWEVQLDHGPYAPKAKAVPVAKKRAAEQSGGAQKKQKGPDGQTIDSGTGTWHYWLDAPMDGRQRGWHLYDSSASEKLEGFLQNKGKQLSRTTWHLQSGYFSYEVDIENMTQRNMKTGTVRPIRRALPGEVVSMTQPPIYIPPKNSGITNQGDVAANGLDDSDDSDEEEKATGKNEPKPLELFRQEENLRNCIHFNEYIVNDTNRINIKYIVEVTSKAWLKRNLKEEAERLKQQQAEEVVNGDDDDDDGDDFKPAGPRKISEKPKEHDMVKVTHGPDEGIEGELVCIDGADAIIKDTNDDFKIVDYACLGVLTGPSPPGGGQALRVTALRRPQLSSDSDDEDLDDSD